MSSLIKYIFGVGGVVLLLAGMWMFASDFPPSSPYRAVYGTGYVSVLATGMKAEVSSPASISVFQFEPFTLSLTAEDGQTSIITSPTPVNGISTLDFTTTGPVEFNMLDAKGGLDTPMIRVTSLDSPDSQVLKVSRTWREPLKQLFQWYMLDVFGLYLLMGLLFIGFALIL